MEEEYLREGGGEGGREETKSKNFSVNYLQGYM